MTTNLGRAHPNLPWVSIVRLISLVFILGQFAATLQFAAPASAAGGSYSITFSAADPATNNAPYLPTYGKVPPSALACPTPSGGTGRAADPLANAIFGDPKDSVQSLAPRSMALGQIVPFEVKISVSGSTAPENGVIQFTPYWLTKTTSGGDFGFDPAYKIYCAFVDTADTAAIDPGANAKVDSWTSTVANTGTSNEQIQGTFQVSGLDNGDSIIVEIWVVLKNTIPAGVTGNVQTGLISAKTASGDTINVGNQTVPLLRVQEFFSSDADVSITKSDSPDPVSLGGTLTYSLVVKNNSTTTIANGVNVTDTLDPNTTFVSGSWPGGTCSESSGSVTCNLGALSQGQQVTITIVVTVKSTAPTAGTVQTGTCTVGATGVDLCNLASVSAITNDPSSSNNSASEPTNVVAAPGIDVEKYVSVDGGTTWQDADSAPGPSLTQGTDPQFKFVVTNTGDIALSSISLSDSDFDLTGCTIPSTLAPSATFECIISATWAIGQQTDTATASGSVGGTAYSDTDNANYFGAAPAIDIQKTPDTQTVVDGGTANFTIVVTNTGNVPLTNVAVTDPLALTCEKTIGDLAVGASDTYTCAVEKVTAGFTNVATATGTYSGATVTDNDDAVVVVDFLPTVDLTKAATPATLAEPGGVFTYTLTIKNTSSEPVTITALTDSNPLSAECVALVGQQLAADASVSCTYTVTDTEAGTYPNTASVTVADNEGNTATDSDDETVTVTDVLPDISITKTAEPTHVAETGGDVTFTFVVSNDGVEAVTLTSLTDDQFGDLNGKGTCTTGILIPAGGSFTCAYTVFLSSDSLTAHTNVVTAVGTDNEGSTDTATDDATVTFDNVPPTITVDKTANPTSVPETGGDVTFTYKVTNTSAEAVTITDLSDSVYGPLAGDADCQVGTVLAAGASCDFSLTETVSGDFSSSPIHTNVFTATVVDNDNTPATATDDATVTLTDVLPDISVTKTGNPLSVPETGGNVTFTFQVTNNGLEAATITALSDDKFGTLAGDADCQVGTILTAGANCSFEATFAIPAGEALGTHVDVFTTTVADNDGNTDTATDDETITYTDVLPDISVTKTAEPTSVAEPGGNVTFTYTVTNSGTEAVQISSLSDDQFGTLAGDADCQVGTTLAVGASCDFTLTKMVTGDASGPAHVDTFTAVAADNDGNSDTATDDATVTFTDVLPTIAVDKTANPTMVVSSGGSVTYTVTVKNTTVEPLTLTSLSDDKFGDLNGKGTCVLPQTIAVSGSYSCTFTETVSGTPGTPYVNTVTGTASDNEGNLATDTGSATVNFYAQTGALLPTQTTCQMYASGNWPAMYESFTYQVKNGKINSVSPGVIFYYNTIKAPSASFTVTVPQTNTLGWKPMLIQATNQAILYNADCSKASGVKVTASGTNPYTVTFTVTGATTDATYYIGIKYSPENLVGQPVKLTGGVYPTSTYMFSTAINGVVMPGSGASIPVKPK